MTNILITGSNGQLGSEIRAISHDFPGFRFTFTDVEELDITNLQEIEHFFSGHRFDAVINCAAYTAVDRAEDEPEVAYLLNSSAVENLVTVAAYHHCFPVHISTDYVFSGKHYVPYKEDDDPDPVSVYGKSKLEGEKSFIRSAETGLIIRTSWLYSIYGKNFIKTILKLAKEKGKLRVVSDQIGCPTHAADLARHILELLPAALERKASGIYHYSNEGVCSWYDLALEAVKLAGIECDVVAVGSEEFPSKAARPYYSVLDKHQIKKDFGIHIPHWRESLQQCIKVLTG